MLRRIVVFGTLLLTLAASSGARAQGDEPHRGPATWVNLGDLLLGLGSLAVEFTPAERVSAYVGAWAYLYEGPLLAPLDEPGGLDWAFGALGGARWHFTAAAPYGVWVGPEVRVGGVQGRVSTGLGADSLAWSASLLVGVSWYLGAGGIVSVGAGPMYVDLQADVGETTAGYEGFTVQPWAAVGFAF